MTAPSPLLAANTLATCAITVDGAPLNSSYQVRAVDVWTGVNRLPMARLAISDGSAADETFPISETAALIPGVALTIAFGYGSGSTTVFSGKIYRQGLEVTTKGPSLLIVEATDAAMVMTLSRSNAVFENQTDSQICTTLITNAGLTAAVTSTSVQHETVIQYYATSWDLLVMRAQASGMVVSVASGTVTVAPPDTNGSPVLTLTYGQSIVDFQASIDASTQYTASAIQSFAWDPATQALATSQQASASVTTPGNLSSATLAAVFNVSDHYQQSAGALQVDELTQWSSAEYMKTQLSKVRGRVKS